MKHKIVLLVRSYNRPEYLEKTLESLDKSDIDKCYQRYIYDDGSTHQRIKPILNKYKSKYTIINGKKNVGCKQSYVEALNRIPNCDYICTIDNDVLVKPNFIEQLYSNFVKAEQMFKTKNILLTGFNPTNAHQNQIKIYDTFYQKRTCGGINFFFHNDFKAFIMKKWLYYLDWGVVGAMNHNKWPLLCLNKGVVNHVGKIGLYSNGKMYDVDDRF